MEIEMKNEIIAVEGELASELEHEVFIDDDKQRWKEKVLRAKMLSMYDMGLNPLSNPKDLNTRVKQKLLWAVEKYLEKDDKEVEDEFNAWCCDEYFKSRKPVENLPCRLKGQPHLPPDMEGLEIEDGICESCSS